MLTANTPISQLTSVGKTIAGRLESLDIKTAGDLLYHFPFRHEDFGQRIAIASLKPGPAVSLSGTIDLIQNRRSKNRRLYVTEALISDDSGQLKVIWFNQPFLAKTLKPGDYVALAGKLESQYGQLTLLSPSYEKRVAADNDSETAGLVSVYPSTSGITQKQLRFLIRQILPLAKSAKDWLPEESRQRLKLLTLEKALMNIHFPASALDLEQARIRLGFDELLLRQLKARLAKRALASLPARPLKFFGDEIRNLIASLPFALTQDQKKSAWEILQDLQKSQPMARLLEGDVGSGKTLVAALALFNTALNGQQGALMAPTEILAHQHYQSFIKLLKDFPIKIALLTNSRQQANFSVKTEKKSSKDSKKQLVAALQSEADILIGTQALIQDNIRLPRLALAIVDEQHRFGVRQRKRLGTSQEAAPHFLSMTATPIPRSLALALYGDLDVSIIKEKPANRQAIITSLINAGNREATYSFIREQIQAGRQAFVVCPLIDESDNLGVKSATVEKEKLDNEIFPELKVGLLHGRLKAAEKEAVMAEFLNNKIQILVATAVVEVGVDVPNASIIIIEGAARFGLAQLHQFRGRVGRGEHQSYCFLSPGEGPAASNPKTLERLRALTKYQDGFALASIDLKLRGGGDSYGTSQSGFPELKIASLFDYALVKSAQEEADRLLGIDSELKRFPELKKALTGWEEALHLE